MESLGIRRFVRLLRGSQACFTRQTKTKDTDNTRRRGTDTCKKRNLWEKCYLVVKKRNLFAKIWGVLHLRQLWGCWSLENERYVFMSTSVTTQNKHAETCVHAFEKVSIGSGVSRRENETKAFPYAWPSITMIIEREKRKTSILYILEKLNNYSRNDVIAVEGCKVWQTQAIHTIAKHS